MTDVCEGYQVMPAVAMKLFERGGGGQAGERLAKAVGERGNQERLVVIAAACDAYLANIRDSTFGQALSGKLSSAEGLLKPGRGNAR